MPWFVLLILSMFAAPLAAQQRVPALDDVQVTATRVAAPASVVPAAVTVIDGEELRRRGIAFLLDALGEVPSAMTVQAGSYGAVASLFLRGGESDYTKLLIDGVPINQPGGLLNLANLRLDDVDRIEIVRGPASVLHGADAVSGVIQIFTRRGAEGVRGEVTAVGGTFGNRDVAGRIGAGSGPWHLSAALSSLRTDGIYQFNSGYRNTGGSVQAGWDGGARGRIALTGRYSDADAHFPTNSSGDVVDRNQHALDRDLVLGLRAAKPLGQLEVVVEGWWHRLATDARDPRDDAADTTGFAFESTRDGVQVRRGAQVGGDWRIQPALTLSARAGIERESEDQQSLTLSDFGFGLDESVGEFFAERLTRQAHLQVLASPVRDVAVQAGVRHDDSDAFGGFTTWRTGLNWNLSNEWRAWGAAGTAFKAPLFSELFAATAFEVGNPSLLPERTRSIEAGFGWQRERAAFSVAGYRQHFDDLIQYVASAPGDPTYVNLGSAEAEGIELTARLRAGRGISLQGSWNWLRTTVTDSGSASSAVFTQGESLLRRPGRSGAVSLLAEPIGGSLAISYRWVGERVDADFRDFPASRITLPSYGTVSVAIGVPLLQSVPGRPGLALMLRGENLFDAEWQQVLGFPGRGRTILVGGRFTY